jgi:hypothetical protein
MGLPIDRLFSRLPRRFPVGAKYVVEGYGGEEEFALDRALRRPAWRAADQCSG